MGDLHNRRAFAVQLVEQEIEPLHFTQEGVFGGRDRRADRLLDLRAARPVELFGQDVQLEVGHASLRQ